MEIDDQIQCKFARIDNGAAKLGLNHKMDDQYQDEEDEGDNRRGAAVDFGSGIGRFYGWPSSRIVRVSRASGGKDRHSKVLTSKGLRDRRVRLSVNTAIQFYDLQDRLGYDQPSKAVEWLLKAAESSIAELPPMNSPFPDTPKQMSDEKRTSTGGSAFDLAELDLDGGHRNYSQQQQAACSSNSDNSKGSGLSLSRSENRIKARERAKERVAAEKENESNSNPISLATSFTELLNGGISNNSSAPMDYFSSGLLAPPFTTAAPLFSVTADHHPELQHYSFMPDHFVPVANSAANLNFTISSSANSSGLASFNRGTLQSNSTSPSVFSHLQRFSDGSAPSFFVGAAESHHHFLSGYGDAHANNGRYSAQRGKGKN